MTRKSLLPAEYLPTALTRVSAAHLEKIKQLAEATGKDPAVVLHEAIDAYLAATDPEHL